MATSRVTEWQRSDSSGLFLKVIQGDAKVGLATIGSDTIHCVVTSPPYFSQRDYKVEGQVGLERTIQEYVSAILSVMREVKRVLRKDGVLFLNLGDTYYSAKGRPHGSDKKSRSRRLGLRAVDASGLGVPRKTTIGIPWRVALQMVDDNWVLRAPIIWQRPGSMPEPTAHDRPWRTHEMLFMFTKSPKYYFNRNALKGEEDIWKIAARPNKANGGHIASFPDALVSRCIESGCPKKGVVLDPFAGSGTVLRVAQSLGRSSIAIDISPEYCAHMIKYLS